MAAGSKDAPSREGGSRAKAYFQRLAEASQDCVWILGPTGEVRYMNGHAGALLGLDPDSPAIAALHDLWPEESRFSLDRAIAAAAGGQSQKFRAFFSGPGDARAYWETLVSPVLDDDGQVFELLVISRDVTAAVETQAFLESVIQLLPAPLTVKNAGDRRFILANRAAEELLDLLPDEALGHTAEEVLPPGHAVAMAEAEAEVLASGEVVRREHRLQLRDGGVRDITVKLLATHDDLGPRHLISIGDDVTERKAAAETLSRALRAADQASRAKSAFLANMSHEIRTPLNGIVASADLLGRGRIDGRDRELVEVIKASGVALDRLLGDVLDVARAEAGEVVVRPEPFRVGEALRAFVAPFRLAAEAKGLTFRLGVDPALETPAWGDAARLRQVLTNLASNAIKFTDAGSITLEAVRPTPDTARFRVADTGVGFDPATKARLFDSFQQADTSYTRRFDGAGLGLAIAKSMVERMGGALDCESRPGEGSAFWFEIPLPSAEAVEHVAPDAAAPAAGLRVLLADDHSANRRIVQLMLSGLADIVEAENGQEAVEACRAQRFDLVLMDMQMPVMDGLAAIREIRREEAATGAARTPIVMISANALPEHRAASAAAGADHHLGKPITSEALFAAIEAGFGAAASVGERRSA